jgi:hypothetical protein
MILVNSLRNIHKGGMGYVFYDCWLYQPTNYQEEP